MTKHYRRTTTRTCTLALLLTAAVAPNAGATTDRPSQGKPTTTQERPSLDRTPDTQAEMLDLYSGYWHAAADQLGKRAPGRNIRRWGVQTDGGTRDARPAEISQGIRTLRAMLHPVVASTSAGVTATTTAAPAAVGGGGRYAIPESIVQCESGGDYNAVNPSSGAYGAYQIMPGTAAAHNCDLSTPGGQDACAGKIMATQGRSAWSC